MQLNCWRPVAEIKKSETEQVMVHMFALGQVIEQGKSIGRELSRASGTDQELPQSAEGFMLLVTELEAFLEVLPGNQVLLLKGSDYHLCF